MENENKTNELEEIKEAYDSQKEEEESVEPAEEEAVQIEEKAEPISYSSAYLENIEFARAQFLKVYRLQNTLKWIVSLISIGAVIFGCLGVPNLVPGTAGTIAMVAILVAALALTILYSVFTKKGMQKRMHNYFDLYYQNVNSFVFDKEGIENIKAQFPGKIEPVAFTDNNLYKDVADVGSRGLTEFEYHSLPIAIVDCAAQVRKEKRVVPVYVGKYLFAASSYDYDEPLYVYFKGDKRALPPTNLEGVKVVQEDKKLAIYSNNKDWKKVINADVKKLFQKIEMNKYLVDLSISLQKGRVFVLMGYDDPLMILPLQEQFNPRPTEVFKEDVQHALDLIEEFNK